MPVRRIHVVRVPLSEGDSCAHPPAAADRRGRSDIGCRCPARLGAVSGGRSRGRLRSAGMALNGSAPAGRQVLTVTAWHLQLAKAASVTGASVQVSFDGGKTWHRASVTALGGGRFRAKFTAPAGAYITLRTTAYDAGGGSITRNHHPRLPNRVRR
jgi:hypothetical protein